MTIQQFGKYEILEPLGSGATAEVYRARDTQLNREVALKLLKPSLVTDASSFARFRSEAQAAARLFHDHIATVLDMGEVKGRYYIAIKYVRGISLDKFLAKRGALPWPAVVRLAQQIGSALDFAHQQGFLHRDVKPANILISHEGGFVLTDFGLTRAMETSGLTSTTGAVMGTPPYIPPEIWNGKPASPASDQYALACVICEAMIGKVLFTGETPQAIITQHLIHQPPFPDAWPQGIPNGVGSVLGRALTKEPGSRYSNASEFASMLANASTTAPSRPDALPIEPVRSNKTASSLNQQDVVALPEISSQKAASRSMSNASSSKPVPSKRARPNPSVKTRSTRSPNQILILLGSVLCITCACMAAAGYGTRQWLNANNLSLPAALGLQPLLTQNMPMDSPIPDASLSTAAPPLLDSITPSVTPIFVPSETATPEPVPSVTTVDSPVITLQPKQLLLDDNFDAGINPSWEVVEGNWIVVNGELTPADKQGGVIFSGDPTWTNFTLDFTLGRSDLDGGGGVYKTSALVRVQDRSN